MESSQHFEALPVKLPHWSNRRPGKLVDVPLLCAGWLPNTDSHDTNPSLVYAPEGPQLTLFVDLSKAHPTYHLHTSSDASGDEPLFSTKNARDINALVLMFHLGRAAQ
jgi:hypothetical protein